MKQVLAKFYDIKKRISNECPMWKTRVGDTLLGILGLVLIFAVPLAGLYGWVANIVTLFHMDVILSGEGVARIVGIPIAPLGMILGYF